MGMEDLSVDDWDRLFGDASDQLTLENTAQIVSNSVGNAIQDIEQPLVSAGQFDGPRVDEISQRARFEFEDFE